MASTLGEGARNRLAALWDSTPTAKIVGPLFTIAIVAVLALLVMNRPDTTVATGPADNGSEVDSPVTAPAPIEEEPESVEDSNPFLIVGNEIVDPDGNIFVPRGVNGAIKITEFPYVFEGGNGGLNGHVDSILAWGWNTVRATLNCYGTDGQPTSQDVIDGIAATVDELTQARIVVILACHDATGSNLELESETEVNVRRFWDQIVTRYRNNPYVWFNFYNEPQAVFDDQAWLDLHRFYYDRYRTQGAENVMVFDLPIYGQAINLLAEDEIFDEMGGCNVLFGWHAWGALDGRQATDDEYLEYAQAVIDRGLAVTITEAGVPQPLTAGTAGNPEWNESGYYAALKVTKSWPIGLLWWHGTGDNSNELFYPLKTDKTGFWTANNSGALTRAGATFWEFSQRERAVEKFSGEVTDSACPSSFEVEYPVDN